MRHGKVVVAVVMMALASRELSAEETATGLDELLAIHISAASRLEQTGRRAPASVAVVTHEEIERFGYRTLAEALASVPGLYVTYDRNYSYLGVRGFSRPTDYNNRILVMVDGYRLNEDVYGYAPLGTDLPIDLSAVDRIEVVRGPGSAAFGTAAMLAVVNVILKQPTTVGATEVLAETGSHGHLGLAARGGGESPSGLGFAWSVSGRQSAGRDHFYPEYAGSGPGSGVAAGADGDRNRSATLVATYAGLELTAFATAREKFFPTGAWEVTFGDPDARTSDGWSVLGLRWQRPLASGLSVIARGQVGHYAYDGVYPGADSEFVDSTDNTWWGSDLQVRWDPRPGHRLIGGVEYRNNNRADYRSSYRGGGDEFHSDNPFEVVSWYAEDELQLHENLLLTTGLRYDTYGGAGSNASPRVALVYLPNDDTTLKLLHGRAFRAPNLYETIYDDPQAGAKGNLDLQPEQVRTTELVAERRLAKSIFAELSLFASDFDGLIEQRVDAADGLLQYQNASGASSRGGELGVKLRSARGWIGSASFSHQRTVYDGSAGQLTNSPSRLWKLGVSGPLRDHLRFSTELVHESGRLTVQGTSTESFLLANGVLAWRPKQPLSLELQIRNILDTDYSFPGGFEHRQAAIAQDGRTFALKLAVRY